MATALPLVTVLLLVARCSGGGYYTLIDGLFPFGLSAGDTEYPRIDDASINIPISSECQYRFYDEKYTTFYLGSNGYITFDGAFTSFIPRPLCESPLPMIAPAWSDVDISDYASGQIFYRQENDPARLADINNIIDAYFNEECGCGFQAQCAFIATWSYVESYCDFFCYYDYYYFYNCYYNGKKKRQTEGEDQQTEEEMKTETESREAGDRGSVLTNTFQTVYVTDNSRKSYVIFIYDNIQWSQCWSNNRAGFSPGTYASDAYGRCVELPYSGTSFFEGIQYESNVGVPGVYMYRVDGFKSKQRLRDPDCEKIGGCCY